MLQSLLESQLATMTSSATLLQREIKREETELSRDIKKLEELKKNAKAVKALGKKQTKNVCWAWSTRVTAQLIVQADVPIRCIRSSGVLNGCPRKLDRLQS